MAQQPEVVRFDFDDRAAIVSRMDDIGARGDGWINFEPVVDEADLPPVGAGLFAFLSARGPQVPLCTWSPPEPRGRAHRYVSLGIEHSIGGRVAPLLAEIGIDVDPRWRVLQDQSKRGFVVAVPLDEDNDRILEWLLRAGTALCPADFANLWHAAIYRRS